jgi:hypothetical protein
MLNSKSKNDRMNRAGAQKPTNYRKAYNGIVKQYETPTAAPKMVRTRLYSAASIDV